MRLASRMWSSNWPASLFWVLLGFAVGFVTAGPFFPEVSEIREWQPLAGALIALSAAAASIYTMREGQEKAELQSAKQRFEAYRSRMKQLADMLTNRDSKKILNTAEIMEFLPIQWEKDLGLLARSETNLQHYDNRLPFIGDYIFARNAMRNWVLDCLERGVMLDYQTPEQVPALDASRKAWIAEYRARKTDNS